MANINEIATKMNINIPGKEQTEMINKNQVPTAPPKGKKRRTWLENKPLETICQIDPNEIRNWQFHDRPESELGDIAALSKDFESIGQQQPCIVRPTPLGTTEKYELIVGERRWRAAKMAKISLNVIIKDLSDKEAALIQSAENSNRKDLSDYAKSRSYNKLIEEGILTQKDIVEKLSISKQQVSRMLSFFKIPNELVTAINDFSNVSARTASEICRLANKGDHYIQIIIKFATLIRKGDLGQEKLYNLVQKEIESQNNITPSPSEKFKAFSIDGKHLFTWKKNNGNKISFNFSKDIEGLINENILNIEDITKSFAKILSEKIAS